MSYDIHEAYSLDSFQDSLFFWEDFEGDSLKDLWSSGGDAGGSGVVVDAQDGGIVRIATGATTNDNWQVTWGENPNEVRTLLVSKKVTMEFRLKLNSTDAEEALSQLLFDINEYIHFRYDTGVGANWYIRTRSGGVGNLLDTGIAADTDYHIFRIECFPTGEVHFYIDGVECGNSPTTTGITASYLEPYFTIKTREDVAKSMDIDYVYIRQNRS